MTDSQFSEKWLPVPGYEGYYSVSDRGRVRREKRAAGATIGQILRPKTKSNGYVDVTLSRHSTKRSHMIHRLVLRAFRGPCPKGWECRHLNGIRTHNHLTNLEWATHTTNMRDKVRHGTASVGVTHGCALLTNNDVVTIRTLYAEGSETQKSMARRYKVASATISHIVNRRNWKHID